MYLVWFQMNTFSHTHKKMLLSCNSVHGPVPLGLDSGVILSLDCNTETSQYADLQPQTSPLYTQETLALFI